MKNLIVFLTVLFLFLLSTQIFSQEDDFFRKRFEYSIPEKIEAPVSSGLQAGTYSVGTVSALSVISRHLTQHLIGSALMALREM
ncbi:MAG: hypothetical protein MUE93_07020 [Ignavibacteriaceae bacterium]|nr:hypothetical protein [Ignavibacteriaceae bacterium]